MSSDPEEHQWVRDLLADAAQDPEPVPDWVSARIEDTLAELGSQDPAAGPSPGQSESGVVQMTPRRHRRWASAVLAAAALTVGGYSLGATGLLGDLTGGQADSTSAGDASSAGEGEAGAGALVEPSGVVAMSSDSLRADARLLAREVSVTPADGDASAEVQAPQEAGEQAKDRGLVTSQSDATKDGSGDRGADGPADSLDSAPCSAPPVPQGGVRSQVSFDGDLATAVLRPLDGGRTRVEVWSCQSPRRVAQVTVRP